MHDVETIGRWVYECAGYEPSSPPLGGCASLAIAIRGRDALDEEPWAVAEADVRTTGVTRRIVLRRGLPPARANYLIGVQLVRLMLEEHGDTWTPELLAGVGTWLVDPPVGPRTGAFEISIARRA